MSKQKTKGSKYARKKQYRNRLCRILGYPPETAPPLPYLQEEARTRTDVATPVRRLEAERAQEANETDEEKHKNETQTDKTPIIQSDNCIPAGAELTNDPSPVLLGG